MYAISNALIYILYP